MSLTKRFADSVGYFNEPDDNPNFEHVEHSEWFAALNGPDSDPDCCAICLREIADERSGLCRACEMNEQDALERDRDEVPNVQ